MDRSQLASRWQMLPDGDLTAVTLYRRLEDSIYDGTNPISVAVAEIRPVSRRTENLFEGVSGSTSRRVFHLWTETFTAPSITGFDPWSLEILPDWIIKESSGREWMIVSADGEQMGSRWRCPAFAHKGGNVITS